MNPPDINSALEINKRLLKAFSVDALKTVFNLAHSNERQAGLLSYIVNTYTPVQINKIIFDHFSLLKQYVYTYEFNGILNDNWLDTHPAFDSKIKITNSHLIFNLLFPIKYVGYNRTQGRMEDFEFLVPVQIHKKKTKLLIHINLLERDISTITADKIIGATRDLNDEAIIKDIVPYANPANLFKYDLNRGIKFLWENDEIDALKVKFKKDKSTSHEIMDENKMIKKEMPALYVELITTPIRLTTFKVLKKNNLTIFFVVDPTTGIFNFSVFPKNLNGINDLIDMVLINN